MKRLLQLVRNTGIWAPALVLVIHEFLHVPGWRQQVDWFNHYSGGLAFSFFAWKSLPLLSGHTGDLTRAGRLGVTFLAGCTAALLWEIGEFSSDVLLHTHIQQSVSETMMDIVNGFLGTMTTVTVATIASVKRLRKISL